MDRYIENSDEALFKENRSVIVNGLFTCLTERQVECSIAFAAYLHSVGITRLNYKLFMKLIETNNKWVVDSLIQQREARLLFATIKPNPYLIDKAFSLLSFFHPSQIYDKVLQAVTGIIEYSFYKPDDGYNIYQLRITDLNSLGKFLDKVKDQEDHNNRMILEILDRMTRMGEYDGDVIKSILAKHAFSIRMSFFDNTKKLHDIIPELLLTKINRELNEVKPSSEYMAFLSGQSLEK